MIELLGFEISYKTCYKSVSTTDWITEPRYKCIPSNEVNKFLEEKSKTYQFHEQNGHIIILKEKGSVGKHIPLYLHIKILPVVEESPLERIAREN